ncbi:MAG: RHS repeat-associated core domain-containing protein [Muribaculaceae bacterium]|nr:RHS repeat-associated core domain-containing protein [Muribaculaceae bacterium]
MTKYRIYLAIATALFVCLGVSGGDFGSGLNWTAEYTPSQAVTAIRTQDSVPVSVRYFDGLGRLVQTVGAARGGSRPGLADYTEYDSRGRAVRQWMAAPCADRMASFTPLSQLADGYAEPAYAYTYSIYELSPSGRPVETRRPGQAWQQAPGVRTEYTFNRTSGLYACRNLDISGDTVRAHGFHKAGILSVTRTTDEDGESVIVFADFLGRRRLSRLVTASGQTRDTYYVYDDYGFLRAALSPAASSQLSSGTVLRLSDPSLLASCHLYEYDYRGNLNKVSVPGGGSTVLASTPTGKPVLSQDLIQARGRIMAYQTYDRQGRPAYRGTMHVASGEPVAAMAGMWRTSFTGEADNTIFGYSIVRSWQTQQDCLAADFYDDYSFLSLFPELSASLAYGAVSGCGGKGDSLKSRGKPTGAVRRVIAPDGKSRLIVSAFYYDSSGRLIQTRTANHLGGSDLCALSLSFDGRPLRVFTRHESPDTTLSVEREYSYDCNLMPVSERIRINGGQWTALTQNSYDAMGRLCRSVLLDGMLPIDYAYTPQGALRSIASGPFCQTLYRETRPDGTKGYMAGQISGQAFSLYTATSPYLASLREGVEACYSYTYDGGRLTDARYTETARVVRSLGSPGMTAPDVHRSPDFSASYAYDACGNVTSVKRHGLLDKRSGPAAGALGARAMNYYYGLLDDLTLQYQGNRLVKVTDAVEDPAYAEANDFADGEDKAAEYEYDAMGRLTADHNKDIRSIQYNVLGLPSDIWAGGGHARYTYDADGTLLCRSWGVDEIKPVLPVGGGWGSGDLGQNPPEYRESSRREWCGDFEYADGAFERMRHSAGWLGADGRHTAEIKDYQGNVRATWTQGNQKTTNPAAVEKGMWYDNVTGYYPYGLPWASMQGQESRLYSGKELERMHALNLYDFHARLYDPQLGRFLSPDPCSTQYEPLSPYLYCAANPILLTDPTGMYFNDGSKDESALIKLCLITIASISKANNSINNSKPGHDIQERLIQLDKSIQDINDMSNDPYREYRLCHYSQGNDSSETYALSDLNENGHQVIVMNSNGFEDTIHENRHGGQVARNEITIPIGQNYPSKFGIENEVDAYKAQFSVYGKLKYQVYLDDKISTYKPIIESGLFSYKYIYDINKITPALIRNFPTPVFKNGIWRQELRYKNLP